MERIYSKLKAIEDMASKMNGISVECGVFPEDGSKEETVTILNLDDTTTEIKMNVADIMFFTQYGTISLPPRPIFENLRREIELPLRLTVKKCLSNMMESQNFNSAYVISELEVLQNRINNEIIPKVIQNILAQNSTIANILEVKDETPYLFDLNKLKKYIKCKIFFKS